MSYTRDWLLYGAYGFTGELIAREAVRRGHRPTLSGRDAGRLEKLAVELGLPWKVSGLDDRSALAALVEPFGVVVHAAGPFAVTAEPMRAACIAASTSYIDITGELPVFVDTYALDEAARERGICLVSGCGFDVVPTDAVAAAIRDILPELNELLLVVDSGTIPSGGTVVSAIGMAEQAGGVRRNGRLVRTPLLTGLERRELPWGRRTLVPLPLGDLESAWRSSGAASITTTFAFPSGALTPLRLAAPIFRLAARSRVFRRIATTAARRFFHGPTARQRESLEARVWGRGIDRDGRSAEVWLSVVEPYRFTAEAAVLAVERILADSPVGALTPSEAFGKDFILGIPGIRKFERRPDASDRQ